MLPIPAPIQIPDKMVDSDRLQLRPRLRRRSPGRNHLPPNYDFSSDFAHCIWEMPENLKHLVKVKKCRFLKEIDANNIHNIGLIKNGIFVMKLAVGSKCTQRTCIIFIFGSATAEKQGKTSDVNFSKRILGQF